MIAEEKKTHLDLVEDHRICPQMSPLIRRRVAALDAWRGGNDWFEFPYCRFAHFISPIFTSHLPRSRFLVATLSYLVLLLLSIPLQFPPLNTKISISSLSSSLHRHRNPHHNPFPSQSLSRISSFNQLQTHSCLLPLALLSPFPFNPHPSRQCSVQISSKGPYFPPTRTRRHQSPN